MRRHLLASLFALATLNYALALPNFDPFAGAAGSLIGQSDSSGNVWQGVGTDFAGAPAAGRFQQSLPCEPPRGDREQRFVCARFGASRARVAEPCRAAYEFAALLFVAAEDHRSLRRAHQQCQQFYLRLQ